MSDYEGEGWNPVDFSTAVPSRQNVIGLTEQITPNGQLPEIFAHGDPARENRGHQSLRPRPAKHFHPLLQNIQPKVHHGTGGRPIERSFGASSTVRNSASFQLYRATPNQPSETYLLDIPWSNFLRAIPETAELQARDIARNGLDNIGVYSEAYVKTPDSDSPRLEIWGTKEQCAKAKERLQSWERHIRSTGTRPSHKVWLKEAAYDGRREDRKRQELWQDLDDQALQEADDSWFGYEAYLTWPDHFQLDTYLRKYEPSVLEEIAKEFRCRFSHHSDTISRTTKVQAETEENMLAAFQRLINLAKEMVAQINKGTHGNFVHLPPLALYRNQVSLDKVAMGRSSPHRATLMGDVMPDNEAVQWEDSRHLYDKQNRAELRLSIQAFLMTLHMSQSYVRLRVTFGELMVREFPKSKLGNRIFAIDEFLTMLQNRRTVATDPILHHQSGDLTWLVDSLSALEQLQDQTESYKHVFEFKGTDATNRLRLEIEMQPGYDFDEPEIHSQRWVTTKTNEQNENILGLKMFDFERPGYMIRVDAYDLFTNDNIIKDMEAFRSAVSFKPARGGVKAYPKLRSTFPSHDKLIAVTEFTSAKFQFKDTDGVLELQREDVYLQNDGAPSKLPSDTRFEILYHYPEWDSVLGELSNVKPGEGVRWTRDMSTFFPDYADPDRPRALPKSFKSFMREVNEIQDLLQSVLSEGPAKNDEMLLDP